MESDEEEVIQSSKDENNCDQTRTKIVAISSSKDMIMIHTNFLQIKDLEVENLIKVDRAVESSNQNG